MSEVFAVDIHPAARFGRGILIDHGEWLGREWWGPVLAVGRAAEVNCVLFWWSWRLTAAHLHGLGTPTAGTGVVIGETAELGNNVSILQNVTLGGTGKVHGDRHPKISDNVLIGASASILGNIRIGKGAQVGCFSCLMWHATSEQRWADRALLALSKGMAVLQAGG